MRSPSQEKQVVKKNDWRSQAAIFTALAQER